MHPAPQWQGKKYLVTTLAQTPLVPIPWDRGSAYTAWVYRLLGHADPGLGQRIHQESGIKPFAITPLEFDSGQATTQGYMPDTPFAALTISTVDPTIATALAAAIPEIPLHIGPMCFQALAVTPYPEPCWNANETVSYRSVYPIALHQWSEARNGRRYTQPKFPRDPDWNVALVQNSVRKIQELLHLNIAPEAITIEAIDGWQARYQTLYGHPIPAFRPRSGLRVTAPPEVHAMLFTLGFGILNSSGLGGLPLDTLSELVPSDFPK